MALRFQTNHDFTDVPIPTTRVPAHSNPTMRRAKTLTRPERGVAPVPLINPQTTDTAPTRIPSSDDYNGSTAWRIFSQVVTFWAPGVLLSSCGGLKEKAVQQAWREKITLCFLIAIIGGAVGFATVGLQKALCPETANTDSRFARLGTMTNILGVQGRVYNITSSKSPAGVSFPALAKSPGQDITGLFQRDAASYASCRGLKFPAATDAPCPTAAACPLPNLTPATLKQLGFSDTNLVVGYSWEQVAERKHFIVLDGVVLNMTVYMNLHPSAVPSDKVDEALRTVILKQDSSSGKDATRLFYNRNDLRAAVPCLKERYMAGNIDKVPPGCFVSQLVLYAGLIVILGLVVVRFIMAIVFNWFLSQRLIAPPDKRDLRRNAISPAVMPAGANVSVDNKHGTAPWAGPAGGQKKLGKSNTLSKGARSLASSSSTTLVDSEPAPVMSLASIGAELFAVCLVTCYSEGEDSLTTTLDSISLTTYSDQRKLLFVIADGMITGAGEKRSTPDICVSLLDADPRFGNPTPMLYGAVGSGSKAQNRAMVYAGHYSTFKPMIHQVLLMLS